MSPNGWQSKSPGYTRKSISTKDGSSGSTAVCWRSDQRTKAREPSPCWNPWPKYCGSTQGFKTGCSMPKTGSRNRAARSNRG